MDIINLCDQNSLVGQFMSEIRNKDLQQVRFRANIQRLGQIMAYEISKRLIYSTVGVTTPLGVKQCNVLDDRVVLATLLRAGLPFHEGFLNFFDGAENAFVSAYRKYFPKTDDFVVHIEYIASPRLDDKTLVIVDPMLATGSSMELAYQALVTKGHPAHIHVASLRPSRSCVSICPRTGPRCGPVTSITSSTSTATSCPAWATAETYSTARKNNQRLETKYK